MPKKEQGLIPPVPTEFYNLLRKRLNWPSDWCNPLHKSQVPLPGCRQEFQSEIPFCDTVLDRFAAERNLSDQINSAVLKHMVEEAREQSELVGELVGEVSDRRDMAQLMYESLRDQKGYNKGLDEDLERLSRNGQNLSRKILQRGYETS